MAASRPPSDPMLLLLISLAGGTPAALSTDRCRSRRPYGAAGRPGVGGGDRARSGRRSMRRLLGLYPRRWRDRYGAEMEALLDDLPPRPATVLDLVRGAARERLLAVAHSTAPRRYAGGPAMPVHPL